MAAAASTASSSAAVGHKRARDDADGGADDNVGPGGPKKANTGAGKHHKLPLTADSAFALWNELYATVTGDSAAAAAGAGAGADAAPAAVAADPARVKAAVEKLLRDNTVLRDASREAKKRESELVIRLTQKEKDIYNLETAMKDMHEESEARAMQLRTTYLDPLVNDAFTALQERVKDLEKKLRAATEDLKAVQFNPQTLTGRQLISKCRRLQEENEEFGRQLSDGRLQRLEADLTLQKMLTEELQHAVAESDAFVLQLDDELEGLEATVDSLRTRRPAAAAAAAAAEDASASSAAEKAKDEPADSVAD